MSAPGAIANADDTASELRIFANWCKNRPRVRRRRTIAWRLDGLVDWVARQLGVRVGCSTLHRLLNRLGFRHRRPRPFHPKADQAALRAEEKGMLTRYEVHKGTEPRQVRDHRYGCPYLRPPVLWGPFVTA